MFFSQEIEEGIKSIVRRMLDGVLEKRLKSDPWDIDDEKRKSLSTMQ